jgi:hypothetical protein
MIPRFFRYTPQRHSLGSYYYDKLHTKRTSFITKGKHSISNQKFICRYLCVFYIESMMRVVLKVHLMMTSYGTIHDHTQGVDR